MDNKFEDFMQNNRGEFDDYEPSGAMWQRIEKRIENPGKKGLLVSMGARKWMSAAAAVVIVAGAAFFFTRKEVTPDKPLAGVQTPVKQQTPDTTETSTQLATTNTDPKPTTLDTLTPIQSTAPELAAATPTLESIESQELAHYTKLVELKQQQITILKKDEPLLYQQFASDFAKIDEEFAELKKQKSKHPNSEQLLEAMLENLKLQSALLNRQLEIVKNINNNKKKRYEKTYKSSI
ncbi:hypothetical protein [Ferruginibacter sp. HRS2-29]|uniref:hypothetical protein n=1 Tax=Ferruginibacter sp. HRS2-29 TaxID=2487334 RepID=UPI0020CCA44A|nr:hypothetical protein [Ferruginibacter sp. HRS2-29]MCP9750130.1 hypothetical protein [Ferruginibacter sp. HRS2-29]